MSRVPHVFVAGPWNTPQLELTAEKQRHLERVLRLSTGAELTYTDGAGHSGKGVLDGGRLIRGQETSRRRTSNLTLAVAPPRSTDRTRFVVEKLSELGIAKLLWIETERSTGSPPRSEKAHSWSIAALEQSLGVWLPEIGVARLDELEGAWLADEGGDPWPRGGFDSQDVVAIGPEGGWTDREKASHDLVSLGEPVFRIETAAVVAAVLDHHL